MHFGRHVSKTLRIPRNVVISFEKIRFLRGRYWRRSLVLPHVLFNQSDTTSLGVFSFSHLVPWRDDLVTGWDQRDMMGLYYAMPMEKMMLNHGKPPENVWLDV